MKSLYACIEINKKNNETEDGVTEKIQYYKTKDELYGIEVVKENNLPNKEIKDITEKSRLQNRNKENIGAQSAESGGAWQKICRYR